MKKRYTVPSLILLFLVGMLLTDCDDQGADPSRQVKSHTYTVSSWDWSAPHHYVNLQVAELNSTNVQSAAVLVYYSVQPDVWISVPYTVYGTFHDYHMGFRYTQGLVEVTWLYDGTTAGDDPNTYYSTSVKCKVVVVPSSARIANPDIDWNDYEDVKTRFGLKD